MRILIVEHEEGLGRLLRDFLSRLGHEPRVAASAVAALAAEDADLVLLDLAMPGLDVLAFLARSEIGAAGIPVVAIAGVLARDEARSYAEQGVLDFLPKPISLDLLQEVLRYGEVFLAQRGLAPRPAERRRSLRPTIALPVRVGEHAGPGWLGTSADVSVFGMKIRPERPVRPGPLALLSFTPPDGGPALQVLAHLIRVDPDGCAYRFVNLSTDEFERLRRLVTRLGSA